MTYAQDELDTPDVRIISSPKNSYVIRGERFETDIYLWGINKTVRDEDITIQVDDEYLTVENSSAHYSTYARRHGTIFYSVKVTITIDGSNYEFSQHFNYEVGDERCIVVSASRMNVFYVGVDNPIMLMAAGVSGRDIRISMAGGTITKSTGYDYIVQVAKPGEVRITVTYAGVQSRFSFRAKRIPDPIPFLGGPDLPEEMEAEVFRKQGGVSLFMKNFDFEAKCDMVQYEVVRFTAEGTRESATNEGARFGEAALVLRDKAEAGDWYIFRNIEGNCPGDDSARKIQGFAVEIK